MKKIIFAALGVVMLYTACNKPGISRDYTKVTLQLESDSVDVVGVPIYVYDSLFWEKKWDSVWVDTAKARVRAVSDEKGMIVLENVEYPDAFLKSRHSDFRFVAEYMWQDTLRQKTYSILVSKGDELRTTFKID